jgi:hypothetical protein
MKYALSIMLIAIAASVFAGGGEGFPWWLQHATPTPTPTNNVDTTAVSPIWFFDADGDVVHHRSRNLISFQMGWWHVEADGDSIPNENLTNVLDWAWYKNDDGDLVPRSIYD